MPDYRVYVIDLDGCFVEAVKLSSENDGAATLGAERIATRTAHNVELWQGDRLVRKFAPYTGFIHNFMGIQHGSRL